MILFCKDILAIPPFVYTGSMAVQRIVFNGVRYMQLTFHTDGIFIPILPKNAIIWMCGGGAAGTTGGSGGGGGHALQINIALVPGHEYAVTIGQGGGKVNQQGIPIGLSGGDTVFGIYSAQGGKTDRTGGSGGGQNGDPAFPANWGYGDGVTTYPFGDTEHFDPHCPGGGGTARILQKYPSGESILSGGNGGTNGGNGGGYRLATRETIMHGLGGHRGGGNGGLTDLGVSIYFGTDASHYGGGGGGGCDEPYSNGAGFKGIVYLRYPD